MAKKTKDTEIGPPVVPEGEVTKYRLASKDTGETLGAVTQVVNKITEEGEQYYKVDITTECKEGHIVDETTTFKITEMLTPISRRMVITNTEGEVVVNSTMACDELELPCAPPIVAGFCLRGLAFAPKLKVDFHLITSEGRFFSIDGSVSSKREKLKVEAGDFECYKVELTPDMGAYMEDLPMKVPLPPGFGMLARQFTNSVCYWFSVDKPNHMVKYEGFLMNSLFSAQVVQELVSCESPTKGHC